VNRPPAVWDAVTGRELVALGDQNTRAGWVRFTPDGRWLVRDNWDFDARPVSLVVVDAKTRQRPRRAGACVTAT